MKKINSWKVLSILLLLISVYLGGKNYQEDWNAGKQSRVILNQIKTKSIQEEMVKDYQPIL